MEKQADSKIKDAVEKGLWVYLANAHLLIPYLYKLEKIMERYHSMNEVH